MGRILCAGLGGGKGQMAGGLRGEPRVSVCAGTCCKSCFLMESLMSFQVSFRKWCLNRCLLFDSIMHLPFIGVEVGMFSGIWQ